MPDTAQEPKSLYGVIVDFGQMIFANKTTAIILTCGIAFSLILGVYYWGQSIQRTDAIAQATKMLEGQLK